MPIPYRRPSRRYPPFPKGSCLGAAPMARHQQFYPHHHAELALALAEPCPYYGSVTVGGAPRDTAQLSPTPK